MVVRFHQPARLCLRPSIRKGRPDDRFGDLRPGVTDPLQRILLGSGLLFIYPRGRSLEPLVGVDHPIEKGHVVVTELDGPDQPLVLDVGCGKIEGIRLRRGLLKETVRLIRECRFHPFLTGQDGHAKPVRLQAGIGITEERNRSIGLCRGRFLVPALAAGAEEKRRQGAEECINLSGHIKMRLIFGCYKNGVFGRSVFSLNDCGQTAISS